MFSSATLSIPSQGTISDYTEGMYTAVHLWQYVASWLHIAHVWVLLHTHCSSMNCGLSLTRNNHFGFGQQMSISMQIFFSTVCSILDHIHTHCP